MAMLIHAKKVSKASEMTTGTKIPATRSAKC
jgi:hypothetical protein